MLIKRLFLSLLVSTCVQKQGWSQPVDFGSSIYKPLKSDCIGVISLPGILPYLEGEIKKPSPVIARTHPRQNAPVLIKLQLRRDLETRETRYEGEDAVVYELKDGWFRVKTKVGMGWISKDDSDNFTQIANVVNYGYLTNEWDGVLYQEPSTASIPIPIKWTAKNFPSESERPGINVVSFLSKDSTTWIKITLTKEIPCSNEFCLNKPVTGWVRAYSKTGFLIVWFYPRGC